jgi:hypothetical protein
LTLGPRDSPRRQYENGIDWTLLSGFRTKITLNGFVAPTIADERRILSAMEHDAFCGITTWENREMEPDLKKAEGDLRMSLAKQKAMEVEMEAMREELDQLKKSKQT